MKNKRLAYRLSASAMNDIQSFESFLKDRNEETVISLLHKRIEDAIFLLREFPELGQYDKETDSRIFPVLKTRYDIVFRVETEILQILRIYHTSKK